MANINKKNRGKMLIRISRNARSNTKSKEIFTIISASLKIISVVWNAYTDKKIIEEYTKLKSFIEHHRDETKKTEIFLNKFNADKCLFYHRFEMVNKSNHFFFMLQKFKNAVHNFSNFIVGLPKTEIENLMMTETKKKKNKIFRKLLNIKNNLVSDNKSFLQKNEKAKTINIATKKISNKSQKSKDKNYEKIINKWQEDLKKELPSFQRLLNEAFIGLEQGLLSIQEKTNKLINIYCSSHVKKLSESIAEMRKTFKEEIENVDIKIDEHLEHSNFFTNIWQLGLFTALKNKIKHRFGTFKEKILEDDKHKVESNYEKLEKVHEGIEYAETFIDDSSKFLKLPAEYLFEGSKLAHKYNDIKMSDVLSILDGETPAKFHGLTKANIEEEFSKSELDLFQESEIIEGIGEKIEIAGAFTKLILSVWSLSKTPKKNEDQIEKFQRKMKFLNDFLGSTKTALSKMIHINHLSPILSSLQSVSEMVVKYYEYRNVVNYVANKIGYVSDLSNNLRKKTLKYIANEVHDKCDLLMHTYDVLNKNKDNINLVFTDASSTYIDDYIKLRKQMAKIRDSEVSKNKISSEYEAEENQFLEIEKSFMSAIASNSLIVASESKIISAYTAYIYKQFDKIEELKSDKSFNLHSTYGVFNRLLVATSRAIYLSLLEVGYEIITFLGFSTNIIAKDKDYVELKDFINTDLIFLMGCRGCGDEVVGKIYIMTLDKYTDGRNKLKEEIKVKQKSQNSEKINYLTFEDKVIIYYSKKIQIKKINDSSEDNKNVECYSDHYDEDFGAIKRIEYELLSNIKILDLGIHLNYYCQGNFFQKIIVNEYSPQTKKSQKYTLDLKIDTTQLRYYIHVEILSNEKTTDVNKILLTCKIIGSLTVCYYLKPLPKISDLPREEAIEYLNKNIPKISSRISKSNYNEKMIVDNYDFFGKTIIPIDDFLVKSGNTVQNLHHGTDIDIIMVTSLYESKKIISSFMIYDKQTVINKTLNNEDNIHKNLSISTNDNRKFFLEYVDKFKENICFKNSICKNFFIDSNRKSRYESISKSFEIYEKIFMKDHITMKMKKQADSKFLLDQLSKTENNYPNQKQNNYHDLSFKETDFVVTVEKSEVLNEVITKSFSGYFLDFLGVKSKTKDNFSLKYVQNHNLIIPPLMKVYGKDSSSFNFFATNSFYASISPEHKNFEITFNQECYDSIKQGSKYIDRSIEHRIFSRIREYQCKI